MKKNYISPLLNVEVVTLDDVVAASGKFGETEIQGQANTPFGELFDLFGE